MDRFELELNILERISQILGEGLELGQVFQHAMTVLTEQLDIQHASLVLRDPATDRLRPFASVGTQVDAPPVDLAGFEADSTSDNPDATSLGQGRKNPPGGWESQIAAAVVTSGKPRVIADISHPPELPTASSAEASMNDPRSEQHPRTSRVISLVSVPIKDGEVFIGAVTVFKPWIDHDTLAADARLLKIIAGLISLAVRMHHVVQLERQQWLEETQQLRENLHSQYKFGNIIGTSEPMLDVLRTIAQVAPTRATCLLLGETGCGKELIAKAIHYNSPRRDKPLIRVNCGALSDQILESELFGHVQGAFTGAVRDNVGRFKAADGGTIFLDEIGTLAPRLQIKLLRVLQERQFEPVGDHRPVTVDVRVIAATNLNLEEEVRKGSFRDDLYYRLNVVALHVPPLRTRREDIPLLIDHFLVRYNKENQRHLQTLSREVLSTLMRYPWPGNVRELENAVERAVVMSTSEHFTEELLPLQIRLFASQGRTNASRDSIQALATRIARQAVKQPNGYDRHGATGRGSRGIYDRVITEIERHLIHEALNLNRQIKVRAADFLGINRNTLNKKVKELKIEASR